MPQPRLLPWDVLLFVFKESDPSTLASLGGVSLDFLASTSPILYRAVETRSFDSLKMLFCERKQERKDGQTKSRINHLLSLSQLRTLSFYFPLDDAIEDDFHVSFHRIDGSKPLLHLQSFTLTFETPPQIQRLFPFLRKSLFHLLRPRRVEYRCLPHPFDRAAWIHLPETSVKEWSDVEILELEGCLLTTHAVWLGTGLGGLPREKDRMGILRLHLFTLPGDNEADKVDARALVGQFGEREYILFSVLAEFASVVLVVRSEEERMEAEEAVQQLKEEKLRSMFTVELEI